MRILDIAHPPMRGEEAEEVLNELLQEARNSSPGFVVKVIHGHGGPAILRQVVQNWAYRNRTRLVAIIPGERYAITDPDTRALRAEFGQEPDDDLGRGNPGFTVLWFS
ncbi:MAG: Smr/MutS family protein [Bacteroidetes bacterium]|jgi:hypothetical protein|nr:Smr/MutS family protein [Bacteroidota bacterium]